MPAAGSAPSRLRDALPGALVALVSMAFTILAIEGGLRAAGYRPYRERHAARLTDPVAGLLLDCYPSNPRGYFDIDLRAPEARAQYGRLAAARRFEAVVRRTPHAVLCRYNAMGFRDRPLGLPVPDVRRVLLIGDSFTEGQGVKEGDSYARVLERALHADGEGRWEVRNCGTRGADFPRLRDTFSEVLPYGADVVVYAMVLNDPFQSAGFVAQQGYLNDWMLLQGRRSGSEADLTGSPSRLWDYARERIENRRVSRESLRFYRDLYAAPNADGWRRTRDAIRTMDAAARARDARFVVVLWPWLVSLDRGYPFEAAHETIRRFCAEAGIPFLDLRATLAARPAESLWVHSVDWHPNEIAHRLAGLAIAPMVREVQVPLQRPGRRVPILSGGVS